MAEHYRRWMSLEGIKRDMLVRMYHSDESLTGTDIWRPMQEIEGRTMTAQIYRHMEPLVESGLVDKGQKNKRANAYQLSDEGRELVRESLAAMTEGELDV